MLTASTQQGSLPRMIRMLLVVVALLVSAKAEAMVGNAPVATGGIAANVVTIVGSRGNFCSGALIAPDVVLTAAHCVQPGADYKIVRMDEARQPTLANIRRILIHPQFTMAAIAQSRASADVALLQLAEPVDGTIALSIGAPIEPISAGQLFEAFGVGVARPGDGKSGGVVRRVSLISTNQPGRLQIRLVDQSTNNTRAGLGACTGDSGGPVTQLQDQRAVIVGVISWSTAPNNAAGCGGLTGVTPLSLYQGWIVQTARGWGATF
jgi:secreted trypsin-like serine protease